MKRFMLLGLLALVAVSLSGGNADASWRWVNEGSIHFIHRSGGGAATPTPQNGGIRDSSFFTRGVDAGGADCSDTTTSISTNHILGIQREQAAEDTITAVVFTLTPTVNSATASGDSVFVNVEGSIDGSTWVPLAWTLESLPGSVLSTDAFGFGEDEYYSGAVLEVTGGDGTAAANNYLWGLAAINDDASTTGGIISIDVSNPYMSHFQTFTMIRLIISATDLVGQYELRGKYWVAD